MPFFSVFKYLASGSMAVSSRLLILWVGVEIFGFSEIKSSIVGAIASILLNYYLQHQYVFNKTGRHYTHFTRFISVVILMQILNVSLFSLIINYTTIYYLLAQAIVIGILFFFNYFINSKFTFNSN